MLFRLNEMIGIILCVFLIFVNIAINMLYSWHYDLRVGLMSAFNWYLYQSIISKPWNKLANIGFAMLLVNIYFKILKYRKISDPVKKAQKYPKIHYLHTRHLFNGYGTVGAGLLILAVNLFYPTHWNATGDPGTLLHNALYYGISRASWNLAIFLIFLAIFTQRFSMGKAFLSGNNMRILAKAMPIMCVVQILVI